MPITSEADQEVAVDERVEEKVAVEIARGVDREEGDLKGGDDSGVEQERRREAHTGCRSKRNAVGQVRAAQGFMARLKLGSASASK